MDSPYLNHFIQPDTIVPDPSNPQAWNRFSYVHNNPINFNDPSGHVVCDADGYCDQNSSINRRNKSGGGNRKYWDERKEREKEASIEQLQKELDEFIQQCSDVPFLPQCLPDDTPTYETFPPEGYYIAGYEDYINWSKVDKIELTVDIAGLLADIGYLTWSTPAAVATVPLTLIAQGIEWIGIGMAVLDVIERNDYEDISIYGLQKVTVEVAKAAKAPRAVPIIGVAFTLGSIVDNIASAVDTRPILQPIPQWSP